ncbi:uncharacterized protein JCM6883_001811 [Sporobolomyces salmoneus]|uniref:uncharacterized protein n=1 Tax=Sporobolomyces salmoneus TaxID=183962 RepID=UPI00317C3E50
MRALDRLLLLLGAVISLGVASAQLSIKVVEPTHFDLTTRFLETIYHEKPDAFFPFLRQLQKYELRPKTKFSDPAFQSSKTLEGKPRPSKYANHNPIFTSLAQPFESWQALEASFLRSRLWKDRGAALIWRTAFANDVAVPTLEAMNKVWEEREKEMSGSKTCQSWIDVAGEKACTSDEFWKIVGTKQIFLREPVKIEGSTPELHLFDRLLPAQRNESLPLVVLYAAPTDEGFPALFDALHKLAQPPAGYPRLQFALRWKVNTESPITLFTGGYDVKAQLESESKVAEIEDLSSRAVAFIDAANDKLAALSQIASSLPLLTSELASTEPSSNPSTAVNNLITLNGVKISNEGGINVETLLDAMKTDTAVLTDISSIAHSNEQFARTILLNTSLTFEGTEPLEFVNLVQAIKDVNPLVTRGSFIEGVTDEDNDVDPPALASIYLVLDFQSLNGRRQIKEALKFLDSTSGVRLAFLHRPSTPVSQESLAAKPYAFSSLLYSLIPSKQLAEVYPSELLAFLDVAIGPNGPKRSLDDMWTRENPITPFLEGGLREEEREKAKSYFDGVRKFAKKLGINEDESAVVINGRVVRLGDSVMSAATLTELVQHELEHRIRPVVEAALPALPPKLAGARLMQAELFNLATSVLTSSGVKTRYETQIDFSTFAPTISISNNSVIPMYTLRAILDPVSPFARKVTPILSTLSQQGLFTVDVSLVPSSSQPTKEELSTLYGSSFRTGPEFDEETLQEIEAVVRFAGLEEGSTLDIYVEIQGEEVTEKHRLEVDREEQVVIFERSRQTANGEEKKQGHQRDEL